MQCSNLLTISIKLITPEVCKKKHSVMDSSNVCSSNIRVEFAFINDESMDVKVKLHIFNQLTSISGILVNKG